MLDSIKEYLLNDVSDRNNTFRRTIFQLIVISSLTILVFLNIFQNTFVVDDPQTFFNWPAVKNMQIEKLVEGAYPTQFQGKAYRPVKGVIFAFEYKIFKENTYFYHLQAIILNLFITFLVYFIIKNITKKSSIAFVGSLIFGIHPVHTEAITFMTASLDGFGILFFFLSFYFYINALKTKRSYYILSLLFAFLAFFSYELTLTLPLIVILYDLCFKKINKKNLYEKIGFYLPYFVFVITFFILRLHFIGRIQGGGYFAESFYLTMLTMTKAVVKYLELFIFPLNLSINPVLSGGIQSYINGFTNLEPLKAQSLFDLDVISSIFTILLTLSIAILFFRRNPIICFSILFIYISLLPILNTIPQLLIMAERYEYIASFGAVLLFAYLFNFIFTYKYKKVEYKKNAQNILIILLIFIVTTFSALTLRRNMDWKDDMSVWTALANQPVKGAIKNSYMGMLYFQQGKYDKATENFKQVIDKKGDIKFANYFLTFISVIKSINQGDKESAEKYYDELIKLSLPSDRANLYSLKKNIDNISSSSSASMQVNNQLLKEFRSQNFSFNYPKSWVLNELGNRTEIQNPNKNFTIEITYSVLSAVVSVNEYIKSQTKNYGTLTNQGLAKIPGVDYAYVKVWNDNNIQKMQFFFFKDKNILEVIVFPTDSSEMKEFDKIIESLKF